MSLLLVAATTQTINAQFSVRLGGGYGLPVAQSSIGEMTHETYNGQVYTATSEDVSASFGAGLQLQAGATYMFSNFVGADLGVLYVSGKKYETGNVQTTPYSDISTAEYQFKGLFVVPSIVITPGQGNLPYCKLGVKVGSPKIKHTEREYYDGDGTYEEEQEWETKGGMSLGFQGTIGMNWLLNNTMKLFTEVGFSSMSYYPKESIMTSDMVNGEERIDDVPVYYKHIEYNKDLKYEQPDGTKPNQQLRQSVPFSALTLQVGVVYAIGGHKVD